MKTFASKLIEWYHSSGRDLPWRRTKDPYRIWLSEVILQQTRVVQGLPYYYRFTWTFPTVRELALATEHEVLLQWQGLGYYTRARNLHAAAQEIMTQWKGTFPSTYQDIRRLKGIGEYTAAAIASISFGLPYPVVDGNVMRFLSRLCGITDPVDRPLTRERITRIARERMDECDPGDFNQAMMEMGALVCLPANPQCSRCPFRSECIAFLEQQTDTIPVRSPAPVLRDRFFHYLVLVVREPDRNRIYLNHRTGRDIWKNLYDFPCVETRQRTSLRKLTRTNLFQKITADGNHEIIPLNPGRIHLLTHQRIHARFFLSYLTGPVDIPCLPVPVDQLGGYPLPRLITRFLNENPEVLR